ncbi:MAG: polysaccharide deacetylase family protein [Candidatus Woesearchaeota archaeon]|jgi:peptidoglycan/xylan/chitin deacetylase (PgdA/CDA1 family)
MKNKTSHRQIFIFSALIFILLFLIYAFWIPSSQIFWKTIHTTSDGNILFTFDDGPGPETSLIVETLKTNNKTAIFFVVCEHIQSEEKILLKNISDSGFEIGLHGKTHSLNEDYNSLKECKDILENITGAQVKYYRPPYGFKAPRTMNAAKELNMTIVLWSIFPRDYNAKNSSIIVKRVERKIEPGAIICMHDGPENREKTAESLKLILNFEN